MINLAAEERRKFALWLRQEAHTGEGLLLQMEKMPGPSMNALKKKARIEIASQTIVAAMLEDVEEFTIGGEDVVADGS